MGSKAPLVASLPPRIFNERGSLELQDLGPLFFLESFDLQVCGLGLGHSPLFFFRLTSNAFLTGSVGRIEKKKITRSLARGGLVPQHHCFGAWKQEDMNPKSISRKWRPGTPASLLWSLETRRHEPKINISQVEAWYPSIIALEPGNKKT